LQESSSHTSAPLENIKVLSMLAMAAGSVVKPTLVDFALTKLQNTRLDSVKGAPKKWQAVFLHPTIAR
jgi:hypothetical protein